MLSSCRATNHPLSQQVGLLRVIDAGNVKMYMNNCHFFFSSGTSLRARTFVRNVGWGGHNLTVGLTLPEVWAQSVQCVARGKPLKLFGLGHT